MVEKSWSSLSMWASNHS